MGRHFGMQNKIQQSRIKNKRNKKTHRVAETFPLGRGLLPHSPQPAHFPVSISPATQASSVWRFLVSTPTQASYPNSPPQPRGSARLGDPRRNRRPRVSRARAGLSGGARRAPRRGSLGWGNPPDPPGNLPPSGAPRPPAELRPQRRGGGSARGPGGRRPPPSSSEQRRSGGNAPPFPAALPAAPARPRGARGRSRFPAPSRALQPGVPQPPSRTCAPSPPRHLPLPPSETSSGPGRTEETASLLS